MASTNTTLLTIPTEIIQDILLELPKADIKSVRLTCQRLSNLASGYLFQRIYFAPRQKVMKDFAKIANHPIFCNSITEVVYDARLFLEYDFHGGDKNKCLNFAHCGRDSAKCGWLAIPIEQKTDV